MSRLVDAFLAIGAPRIAVVGDLMLDRYIWGSVTRISPEAPVPILKVDSEDERLGGAGSVLNNLVTLGASVFPVTAVGADAQGRRLLALLREIGIGEDAITEVPGRQTTQKSRLIARSQHVLRVDRETDAPYPAEAQKALQDAAERGARWADVVLISDYGKGIVTRPLIERVLAGAAGKPVLADPFRDRDFTVFRGITLVTPNRLETARATGIHPATPELAFEAGRALIRTVGLDHAIITMDRDGMALVSKNGATRHFPTEPRQVFDVAGAGDMVLSVLGFALAGGLPVEDAIPIANVAGGLEVQRLGVRPIPKVEIAAALKQGSTPYGEKIRTREAIAELAGTLRRAGRRIVFTNGCFDILHVGHVRLLQFARAQGDVLMVGLNSDRSVRRLKGPSRPVLAEEERAHLLCSLTDVDYVTVFDEETPIDLIRTILPHVLVKGEDYQGKVVVGREVVEAAGGRVVLAPLVEGVSTTAIVDRIAGERGK